MGRRWSIPLIEPGRWQRTDTLLPPALEYACKLLWPTFASLQLFQTLKAIPLNSTVSLTLSSRAGWVGNRSLSFTEPFFQWRGERTNTLPILQKNMATTSFSELVSSSTTWRKIIQRFFIEFTNSSRRTVAEKINFWRHDPRKTDDLVQAQKLCYDAFERQLRLNEAEKMILIQVTNSSSRDAKMFCMYFPSSPILREKKKKLTKFRALARRQPCGLLCNANLHHVAGQAWQRGHQSCEQSHLSLESPWGNLQNPAESIESILRIGLSWYLTICSG